MFGQSDTPTTCDHSRLFATTRNYASTKHDRIETSDSRVFCEWSRVVGVSFCPNIVQPPFYGSAAVLKWPV